MGLEVNVVIKEAEKNVEEKKITKKEYLNWLENNFG